VLGTAEMAGVRARFPLLDYKLAELSGRVPAALKMRGFEKRFIFKEAMKDILPHNVLYKKKHGFGVPVALWFLQDPRLESLVLRHLDGFTHPAARLFPSGISGSSAETASRQGCAFLRRDSLVSGGTGALASPAPRTLCGDCLCGLIAFRQAAPGPDSQTWVDASIPRKPLLDCAN